MLMLVLRC